MEIAVGGGGEGGVRGECTHLCKKSKPFSIF